MNPSSFLRRRLLAAGAAVALGTQVDRPAFADTKAWPTRALRLVVPFAPGSSTDMAARMFAKSLSELCGQPVVVENRAGGNGIPAVQAVLAAPADGYTVFFSSNSSLTTNAAIYKNLPYDPLSDFTPVTMIAAGNIAIVVPAASPYRTLADLLADARRRPGALNMGAGTPAYALWGAWLNEIAGVKTTQVLYKGVGDVVVAIGGNQLDYAVIDVVQTTEMSKSGRLRALAVTGEQRHGPLPQVPTVTEAGVRGFNAIAWSGVVVAARTPAPVVQELARLFEAASNTAEITAFLDRIAMKRMPAGPEFMRTFQAEEIARWKRLIASTGIQVE